MTRRSKAQWQALIETYERSGMTGVAFCCEHGLNPKYFSLRRRQFLDAERQTSSRFVGVSILKPSSGERINLRDPSGAVVELPPSISAQWLAQLLHALRG
jgi:hypothetical protein